jgi:uncharacterized BrkB/YihY/UPF0761 family membrane protein
MTNKKNDKNPFGKFNWKDWRHMLPVFLVLTVLIFLGYRYHVDHRVIAGGAVVIGLLSGALAWLVGVIGLVPFIGPVIVKVLSIGFIWLLNAVGYVISYIAIKRGYSQDVLTYRGLTIALIVGIIIGYIIAQYI